MFLFVVLQTMGLRHWGTLSDRDAGSDVSTWVHLLKAAAEDQGALH